MVCWPQILGDPFDSLLSIHQDWQREGKNKKWEQEDKPFSQDAMGFEQMKGKQLKIYELRCTWSNFSLQTQHKMKLSTSKLE